MRREDEKYKAGDFLYGIPSSIESESYNPEDCRVFIFDGKIDGDGYGKLIGFEDGKLVKSTGYGNFCWGGDVRYATPEEITQFIRKVHVCESIPYRR